MLYPKFTWVMVIPVLLSCKTNEQKISGPTGADTSNVIPLEDAELRLFDGATLIGWHEYNRGSQEIKSWTIIDSSLVCLGSANQSSGGDLVTDREYGNFELSWEWKLEEGSNSGVLYHVKEDPKYKSPSETGPEFQVIDDIGYPEKLESWQQSGADYAMHPASAAKKLKPIGEWNSSKILYNQGHTEHWLNGKKIVEFERGTPDWQKLRMNSKWKNFPDYARFNTGKIVLQDYGKKAWYRNIVIKEL